MVLGGPEVVGGRSSADPRSEVGGGRHVDGVLSGQSSAHPGPWVGRPGGRHVGGLQHIQGRRSVGAVMWTGSWWVVLGAPRMWVGGKKSQSLHPWVSGRVSRCREWGEGILTRGGGVWRPHVRGGGVCDVATREGRPAAAVAVLPVIWRHGGAVGALCGWVR